MFVFLKVSKKYLISVLSIPKCDVTPLVFSINLYSYLHFEIFKSLVMLKKKTLFEFSNDDKILIFQTTCQYFLTTT